MIFLYLKTLLVFFIILMQSYIIISNLTEIEIFRDEMALILVSKCENLIETIKLLNYKAKVGAIIEIQIQQPLFRFRF